MRGADGLAAARMLRHGGADQAVAGDEGRELGLAPTICAGGALGQDHVAQLGRAVVDHDGDGPKRLRRVCCIRYLIPSLKLCSTCPLVKARPA